LNLHDPLGRPAAFCIKENTWQVKISGLTKGLGHIGGGVFDPVPPMCSSDRSSICRSKISPSWTSFRGDARV